MRCRWSKHRRSFGCLLGVVPLAWHGAASAAPPSPKLVKGPYLQALASTSVELRAELDVPGALSVTLAPVGPSDAGAPRTLRDDAATQMHVVRVDGLVPSTHYSYSVAAGSGAASPASARGELTTAPPDGSTAPFSFVVYGDNRSDDAAHAAIVREVLQTPSDFIVNTGDLVLDGASDANWQSFFDLEAPLIRDRNVFSCVGNHEITDDGAGGNYLRYFGPTSDAHGAGEKPKLYGSFRWGDARFFLLDAMDSFDSDAERAWLDDELTRADAEAGLVWRIVVMHHGPWSAGPHGGNGRAIRAGIPALFAAHHIDLVLAGHDHIYERGFASGIRYVVSGGGGAPLYEIKGALASTRKVESAHHIVEVAVQGDAVHLVAKRDDGSVLDRCGFAKGHDGWDCDPPAASTDRAKSEPVKDAPAAPSASRWGCSAVGGAADAPLAWAWALVGATFARRRRRGSFAG